MRYLVVTDLHSNWEALQAVLENSKDRYDRVVCCGDLAGYGPDPNRVLDWARTTLHAVIRGNHDRACAGLTDLEWFNSVARAACIWTSSQLTPANLEYIRELAAGPLTVDGFQLIHGSPLDEDEYLVTAADARNVFSYLEGNLAFFGHTHQQGGFVWNKARYQAIARPRPGAPGLELRLDPDAAYMVNPGSVGQPRDGDARAAYALFDTESRIVNLCRVPYDYKATLRKIIEAGLPEVLGLRLGTGN